MALVRVFYGADEKVFVYHGVDLDIPIIQNPGKYESMDYEDIDSSQLPSDRGDRDRWRGGKTNGIRVDMYIVLRKDLYKQIDDELAKQNPNVIAIERLRRKLEKREHD